MVRILSNLWADEQGQDLTEYALLLVLVALSAIAGMSKIGSTISDVFSNAAGNLTNT